MDDNKFDDVIKGKVGEFQEPGFDPTALSDLHYRLASANTIWPWYSRYRTELFTGAGLVLCTLIILWSQWYLNGKEASANNENAISAIDQPNQVAELQKELEFLRKITPDTIRVIEYQTESAAIYTTLLNRIASLETTLDSYLSQSEAEPVLIAGETPFSDSNVSHQTDATMSSRLTPKQKNLKSVRAQWDGKFTDIEKEQRALSVKAIRDIQNHYQKGIGILVGPTLEMSKGIYSTGNGGLDFTGGLLADFILSPSISLETGGKFVHRAYSVSEQSALADKTFPSVDQGLGTPKNADIDSWIVEVPINIKYRYPVSLKRHLLTGVGYSPMLYTQQVIEYDYELAGNPSASMYSVYKQESPKLYSGGLNFILGISNETKRKNILETSLYYQHGLNGVGVEDVNQNFLGVRGVYWFKIR